MYIFFDTETTGFATNMNGSWNDLQNWPRMVQIAWVEYDENGKKTEEVNLIIKPDGFIIPQETINIHRITNERAKSEGVSAHEALSKFSEALNRNSYLVAHNIKFDLGVVGSEFFRYQIENKLDKIYPVDTMLLTVDYCKLKGQKGRYKFPKLSELYFKLFNTTFDGAHDAIVDVKALAKCFFQLQNLSVIGFKEKPSDVSKDFSSSNTSDVISGEKLEKPLTHFSCHTFFSILKGAGSVDEYLKRAKELGHKNLCITDNDTLSSSIELWQKARKYGIKPIFGVELNVNEFIGENPETNKDYNSTNFPIKIIIKNKEGYVNLNKLIYLANSEGFDGNRPRIKLKWLFENKEGLIVTAGDYKSIIADYLLKGIKDKAIAMWEIFNTEFADDFITEIKFFEVDEQKRYNNFLLHMAKQNKKMVILDNDVHYIHPKDNELQDIVSAIGQGRAMRDCKLLDRRSLFYLDRKGYLNLNKRFGYNYPESVLDVFMDNTNVLAEKCNFDFEVGKENYPKYEATEDVVSYFKTSDSDEILKKLSFAKLKQKLKRKSDKGKIKLDNETIEKYTKRLEYELEIIKQKKISDYFLVNWEILRDYRAKGFETGSARGCFVPESLVFIENGKSKAIQDIEIREVVLDAYGNEQTVENVFCYDIDEEIIILEFENGKVIKCTKEHLILTKNKGWVKAVELNEECFIKQIDVAHSTKIKSKKTIQYKGKVYDLQVSKSHTFNVNGISVHNSAAGCLVSWLIDITKIDPLQFGLYFERFLNPTRNNSPDIDIDYSADTDHITTEFLNSKYGKERVFPVGTFLTFNAKGCIKDVVRAYRGTEETGAGSVIHRVTKEMPDFDKMNYDLRWWVENYPQDHGCSPEVKNWLIDPENKPLIENAIKLQGQPRGFGQHAAGVVITPGPSWNYIPTNIIASKGSVVSAFQEADRSGKDLSLLGILKLDRLKLETVNIILETIKLIKEDKGIDLFDTVMNIDEQFHDKSLYNEIRLGENHGIFQFESPGMNALIKGIKIENFDEMAAANAIFRPGPMGIGAHREYIENKFHPENAKYIHPLIEKILKETNGVMIYQEQVQFIANEIGGMSLGEGDLLRRHMEKIDKISPKIINDEDLNEEEKSSKDYIGFTKYWNQFAEGAKSKGLSEEEINSIKNYMLKYSGYSFNKSHSVSYAYIAMQTLYLKHYYPTHFYTALLNNPKSSGDKDKQKEWLTLTIAAAINKGIKINKPNRKSKWKWAMTGEKEITMGFSSINGVGDIAYDELINLLKQKNKSFVNISMAAFFDLPFSKFNKTAFSACAKAGMFDDWSSSREYLIHLKTKKKKPKIANQFALFDVDEIAYTGTIDSSKFKSESEAEKSAQFEEVCGFNLDYIIRIGNIRNKINELAKKSDKIVLPVTQVEADEYYWFIVQDIENKKDKNGKPYICIKASDGISNASFNLFGATKDKILPEIERQGVYLGKFKKNEKGFLNFDSRGKIKRVGHLSEKIFES